MTTATNIYYGSRIGYIAELSDGTFRKVQELNRLGIRISKVLVVNLLDNPISVAWRCKPFLAPCPATMSRVILSTINATLAGKNSLEV